jgi:hypothetical protein
MLPDGSFVGDDKTHLAAFPTQEYAGNFNYAQPSELDKCGQQEYHSVLLNKHPARKSRLVLLTGRLYYRSFPSTYDYVVMSHAGPTHVAPVGPGSPQLWRAFLFQAGLPWQATFAIIYTSSS